MVSVQPYGYKVIVVIAEADDKKVSKEYRSTDSNRTGTTRSFARCWSRTSEEQAEEEHQSNGRGRSSWDHGNQLRRAELTLHPRDGGPSGGLPWPCLAASGDGWLLARWLARTKKYLTDYCTFFCNLLGESKLAS